MKKLFIYKKTGFINRDGSSEVALSRTVTVHPSFTGIGKSGAINKSEFKKLAEYLEPGYSNIDVIDV